jgi:hypothetical protein
MLGFHLSMPKFYWFDTVIPNFVTIPIKFSVQNVVTTRQKKFIFALKLSWTR